MCFRLGRGPLERERKTQGKGPERGSEQKDKSAKSVSSVSSLPGTPQINTSSSVLLVRFPPSSTSFHPAAICPPSHRQPPPRGKAWFHSFCLETSSFSTQVTYSKVYGALLINNRALNGERLYLELHSRLRSSIIPCMDAVRVSGPRHSIVSWGYVQVRDRKSVV